MPTSEPARAQARATEYNTQAFRVDELLAHPDVQIIINLTVPRAHGEVGIATVEAGKSIYNEKPLALTREEAQRLSTVADETKCVWAARPTPSWAAAFKPAAS